MAKPLQMMPSGQTAAKPPRQPQAAIAEAAVAAHMLQKNHFAAAESMIPIIGALTLTTSGTVVTISLTVCAAIAAVGWTVVWVVRSWSARTPAQLRANAVNRRAHRARRGDNSRDKIAYELSANLTVAIEKGDHHTAKVISNNILELSRQVSDQLLPTSEADPIR